MKNIALSGCIASGKSFIANEIIKQLPSAKRVSFAGKIKEIITDVYGPMSIKNRHMLTTIGMTFRSINDVTWINVVDRFIKGFSNKITWILDDLRFENEYKYLRKNKWFIIRFKISKELQKSRITQKYKNNKNQHLKFTKHISESLNLPDKSYDLIIEISDKDNLYILKTANNELFYIPKDDNKTLIEFIIKLANK